MAFSKCSIPSSANVTMLKVGPMIIDETIRPTYDSKRSAPIPATLPTLSRRYRQSPLVAWSSLGMPASIPPNKSARRQLLSCISSTTARTKRLMTRPWKSPTELSTHHPHYLHQQVRERATQKQNAQAEHTKSNYAHAHDGAARKCDV